MPFDTASGAPLAGSASSGRGVRAQGPAAREGWTEEAIELLISWGAAHDPETAILWSLSAPPGGLPATLRMLQRTGSGLIPDDLRREVEAILPLLRDGSEPPVSLRTRMQRVIDSASPHVDQALADRQTLLREAILVHGTLAGADPIRRALRALWASEQSAGLPERLRALSELGDAAVPLSDPDSAPGSATRSEPGPAAAGSSAPIDVPDRLSRLGSVLEAAAATPSEGSGGAIREEAIREYQRLVDLPLSSSSSAAQVDSLLSIWERVLAPGLAAGPSLDPGATVGPLAARLDEMVRSLPRGAEAVARLRSASSIGTAAGALAEAAEHLARVRAPEAGKTKETGSRLQATAREAGDLIRRHAPLLPAELLVRGRALLEQVPSALSAGAAEAIPALEKDLRPLVDEMRTLASTGEQRRTRHAEKARSALQERVEELAGVASPGVARRLARLRDEAKSADGARLRAVMDRLEPLERQIEQAVRHSAEREAARARRWLQKHAAPGKERPGQRELAAGVEALTRALGGDDLVAIRDRARETRPLYLRLAPGARPALRAAAAILLLAAAVGAYFAMNAVQNREFPIRVDLQGPWREMWVVRNGRIVRTVEKGGSSELTLAPGRYDIYVDGRFTGRVIEVPTEKVINQVPLAPPAGSAGN